MFDNIIGQTKNDFSVTVTDRDWRSEWQEMFSKQIVSVEMRLMDAVLLIGVRQLKVGNIQDVIFHLITAQGNKIDIIRLRPAKSKKKGAEYVFSNGRLTDHVTEFNYASKGDVVHYLAFKFERVNLYSPTNEQPITHYASSEEDRINKVLNEIADIHDDLPLPNEPGILKTNNPKEV